MPFKLIAQGYNISSSKETGDAELLEWFKDDIVFLVRRQGFRVVFAFDEVDIMLLSARTVIEGVPITLI